MKSNRQTIKDFQYRILGFIDTQPDGVQVGRDRALRIVGKYYPKQDVTKDFYGRIVSRGNTLSTLFNMFEQK